MSTTVSSSASTGSSGAPPPPSPGTCTKGTACCVGAQSYDYCASSTTCITNGGKPYGCSGTDTCAAGHVCCLVMEDAGANPKVTDSCPRTISKSGIQEARCEQTACGATETKICRASSECTSPAQCRRVSFTTGDGTITLGVCL